LISTANYHPDVAISPTNDLVKFLAKLSTIKIGGMSDVTRSVKIAQLALKNRQNKHQRQRIVTFVCSPLSDNDVTQLIKLGKILKKNNVAIDIISMGGYDNNDRILKEFVDAANANENSHFICIPNHVPVLSDALVSSSLFADDDQGMAGNTGGNFGMDMGVNPNDDPELAMAIKISLEEARAREADENKKNKEGQNKDSNMNVETDVVNEKEDD